MRRSTAHSRFLFILSFTISAVLTTAMVGLGLVALAIAWAVP